MTTMVDCGDFQTLRKRQVEHPNVKAIALAKQRGQVEASGNQEMVERAAALTRLSCEIVFVMQSVHDYTV